MGGRSFTTVGLMAIGMIIAVAIVVYGIIFLVQGISEKKPKKIIIAIVLFVVVVAAFFIFKGYYFG